MYYEEKFFNGDWWWRNTPKGLWYKFEYARLLKKTIELEERLQSKRIRESCDMSCRERECNCFEN